MNPRSTPFGDKIKTPFGRIFSLINLHYQTRGLCLTISASKGGQMYRNACSPLQATGVFIRRLTLILAGDRIVLVTAPYIIY
ncbi:hypothetical protein PSI23_08840 [Xenorhabdus sp. XENO-10]|uniref:Uncharacterized protein n=1 Tax=Xenorhabdus yunnanensis TaxID=3025878 RepID=A0ABT5LEN5_9GAMM|nr:hypothetical protein [Xenorhabdus yunnanensis]MDC9589419.1 hypothetical protein [Xenorhabdus yunnanensis]